MCVVNCDGAIDVGIPKRSFVRRGLQLTVTRRHGTDMTTDEKSKLKNRSRNFISRIGITNSPKGEKEHTLSLHQPGYIASIRFSILAHC